MFFPLILHAAVVSVTAHDIFRSADDYKFRIIDGQFATHKEARKECKKLGGDLAILRNKEQENILLNQLKTKDYYKGNDSK